MKQPTRLGELGGKLLPYFGYKRAWGLRGRVSTPLAIRFHLKLVRRRRKKEKIKVEVLL